MLFEYFAVKHLGQRRMEGDTEYFRRRASEERMAASRARDARARNSHVQMAERYEDLVRGIAKHEQVLGFRAICCRGTGDLRHSQMPPERRRRLCLSRHRGCSCCAGAAAGSAQAMRAATGS